MRKDIKVSIDNGDFIPDNKNKNIVCSEYTDIYYTERETNMSPNRFYIDCYVKKDLDTIFAEIPYIPSSMLLMVRFHYDNRTIRNNVDGGYWFGVFNQNLPVKACKLGVISDTSRFIFKINNVSGEAEIYNLDEVDFLIDDSQYQDAYLLTKMRKGGYLKEVNSGVGIMDYINSTVEDGEIADKIKDELHSDGLSVDNIYMDKNKDVYIDLK